MTINMNFLEKLVAEWYSYNGYFVRTNVKFGRIPRGGYIGEMDVIAYKAETQEFIHIETSTDAHNWPKRVTRFQRKFRDARQHYMQIFPFKSVQPKQIAIVGFNKKRTTNTFGGQIEIKHIPEFMNEVIAGLKGKDPQKDAVPEGYPLLRAIQYSAFYNITK